MGRKPNQLILEFFERGAKLQDSSNRYQFTCRSCGEKFPKGRIDSLNAHLLKTCPAISQGDRERVFLQMHNPQSFYQAGVGIGGSLKRISDPGPALDLPYHSDHNLSALETLAEVSRQHLGFTGEGNVTGNPDQRQRQRQRQRQDTARKNGALSALSATDFLVPDSDDQLHHTENASGADGNNLPVFAAASSPFQGLTDFAHQNNLAVSSNLAASLSASGAPIAPMAPAQQLAFTASAANDMIPNTGLTAESESSAHPSNPAQRYVQVQQSQSSAYSAASAIDPLLQESNSVAHTSPEGTDSRSDWSLSQKTVRPKVRGRFSDSRRKEVQQVRKQGACVRCRMLKKPCSGGTPCTTCESVESARLWKQPCIRTRIAEEFDLYSAGLYTVLAFHETSQAKAEIRFEPSSNNVAATHFVNGSASNFVSVSSLGGQRFHADQIEPAFSTTPKVSLLNQDKDDILMKLELYLKTNSREFFEQESSDFMRSTLQIASELSLKRMDPLLSRSLELWAATHVLADSDIMWTLYNDPDGGLIDPEGQATGQISPITIEANPATCRLITAQLHAFMEKRAAQLAKSLMNDLERRLLQRQQAQTQQFETFLIAIILLNCVEKMCWLFHVWDMNIDARYERHSELSPHVRGSWPLDTQPAVYVAKGVRFSELLTMLLRMRAIPPKMALDKDGVFVAKNSEDEDAASWLSSVKLSKRLLEQQEEPQHTSLIDSRCWELRYVSRLLLSE